MILRPREDAIVSAILANVAMNIMGGLSYDEGLIAFRCSIFVMEEIDRNPQINDEALASFAKQLVQQEIEAKK